MQNDKPLYLWSLEEAIRNLMRNEFQKEYFRTVSEGK